MKLALDPRFVNDWLWLCPLAAVLLGAGVLLILGFSWWTALLAALLAVCPLLILWGGVQAWIGERRSGR